MKDVYTPLFAIPIRIHDISAYAPDTMLDDLTPEDTATLLHALQHRLMDENVVKHTGTPDITTKTLSQAWRRAPELFVPSESVRAGMIATLDRVAHDLDCPNPNLCTPHVRNETGEISYSDEPGYQAWADAREKRAGQPLPTLSDVTDRILTGALGNASPKRGGRGDN